MPPARGSAHVPSLQFVHEKRENVERYRPYRNPGRIAINDKKRLSGRTGAQKGETLQNNAHDGDWNDILTASSESSPTSLSCQSVVTSTTQLPDFVTRDTVHQIRHLHAAGQQHSTPSPSTPTSAAFANDSPYDTASPSSQTTSSVTSRPHSPEMMSPSPSPIKQQAVHHFPYHVAATGIHAVHPSSFQKPASFANGTPLAYGAPQSSTGGASDLFADAAPHDFLHSPVALPPNPIPSQVAAWEDDLSSETAYPHPDVAPHGDVVQLNFGCFDGSDAMTDHGPSFWTPDDLPTGSFSNLLPTYTPPQNSDIAIFDDAGYGDRLFFPMDLSSEYLADRT